MKKKSVNKKVIGVIIVTMLLQCLPLTTWAAESNNSSKVSISGIKLLTDAKYARKYRKQAYANVNYGDKKFLKKRAKELIGNKTGRSRTKGIYRFEAERAFIKLGGTGLKIAPFLFSAVPITVEGLSKTSSKISSKITSSIKLPIKNYIKKGKRFYAK